MNRGTISGLGPDIGWRTFTPTRPLLAGFATAGGVTQPSLGSSTVVAHYFYDRGSSTVVYQGYVQFDSSATFGSGDEVWGILLPVPAMRVLQNSGMPLGVGWAWQGSAGNTNVPLRATLLDPILDGGTQSNEDNYLQFTLPYTVASGTGSITGSNTSTTLNHTLGHTPTEFDFHIQPTTNPTNVCAYWYITNITSTQFTVNVEASPGATALSFSWKGRGEPKGTTAHDNLVNSARPIGGGWASGYVLGWYVEYRARR